MDLGIIAGVIYVILGVVSLLWLFGYNLDNHDWTVKELKSCFATLKWNDWFLFVFVIVFLAAWPIFVAVMILEKYF